MINSTKPSSLSPIRLLSGVTPYLLFLCLTFSAIPAMADWPHIVFSKDGTPISYEVNGNGEPGLVFVHGWSCDSRYWREQAPYFSKTYRVVTIDLAGHGHSGFSRSKYTMKAFGEDVKAVTDVSGADKVILIGHSMGGSVIAEAARLMPERVIGLIGIDTLQNIEYPLTSDELKKMTAPMKADFKSGCRDFVSEMMRPGTDPKLREWILSDMSAAPPSVALSAIQEMMSRYITGEAANVFDAIKAPVLTVNADLWPVNYKANRRHMAFFDAIILQDTDHFLMMAHPEKFNRALAKAIQRILNRPE